MTAGNLASITERTGRPDELKIKRHCAKYEKRSGSRPTPPMDDINRPDHHPADLFKEPYLIVGHSA